MSDKYEKYEKSVSDKFLSRPFLVTQMPTQGFEDSIKKELVNKILRKGNSQVIENEKLLSQRILKQKVFTNLMVMHNKLYKKWRTFDLWTAILTFIGIILAIVEYEVGFKTFENSRSNLDISRNLMRLVVLLISLASWVTIIIRYYFKRKWQNLPIPKEVQNQVYNNDYTNLMRQNRRKRFVSWKLIVETIILAICPIPFYEYGFYISQFVVGHEEAISAYYLLSDMILIAMFSRFYIVLRNIFNHTEFSDPYAKLHWERHGFTANTRFCFKCYLAKYPGYTVLGTLTLSVFILGYSIRIAERPALKAVNGWTNVSFIHHFYLVIITMTTVGFGDFFPITALGKMITVLNAFWGGFIISLLIVSVNEIFSLSIPQKIAYDKLIRVKSAAKWIIAALRFQVVKKKFKRVSVNDITDISRNSAVYDALIDRVSGLLMFSIRRPSKKKWNISKTYLKTTDSPRRRTQLPSK
jgi:hypothetical protein